MKTVIQDDTMPASTAECPAGNHAVASSESERDKTVVLRLNALRKSFGGQVVLDGVSTNLHRGEVVLLRGDNGTGKTTLLNILTGNLPPDSGQISLVADGTEEVFDFPQRWWQEINPFNHFTPERVAREAVGRTWQDVRLFATQSLVDNVCVALPGQRGEHPLSALMRPATVRSQEESNRSKSLAILDKLGLRERTQSSADMISLGQSKRVAISRAVQAGARILFLDEPLAGLDANGVRDVMDLLESLVREHRITLVIVEHVFNIPRILALADTVWTLAHGTLTASPKVQGPTDLRHLSANPILDQVRSVIGPGSTEIVHSLPAGASLTIFRTRQAGIPTASRPPVLEVHSIVAQRGRRRVLGWASPNGFVEPLSIILKPGETALLEAPNGWGKTTLIECIAGLLPIQAGTIFLNGANASSAPPWQRSRMGMSYLVAQNFGFGSMTVQETLQLAGAKAEYLTAKLLPRRMDSLSGGELQRVAIAAISPSALVRLLDEPFAGLDGKEVVSNRTANLIRASEDQAVLITVPAPAA